MRQYLFSFYLRKIKFKRPEVNSETTNFLTFMNNSKAFSSLDAMACSYQCSNQFQFLSGHWPAKRHWILKKPNLKIILITPGIIWSLKFKTKRMAELGLHWFKIHDPTMHDSCINYISLCMPETDWRERYSPHRIEKSKDFTE